MIKSKKLKVGRETLVVLSTRALAGAHGGVGATVTCTTYSVKPVACEPSGIIACTA